MAGSLSFEDMVSALRAFAEQQYPGALLKRLTLLLIVDGREEETSLLMPRCVGVAAARASQPPRPEPATRHSSDFRSVYWYGTDHNFTPTQAAIVRLLWEAWQAGAPDVSQETLLEQSGSESKRLRDVFRGHEAFGTMIAAGESRGSFRLWEP